MAAALLRGTGGATIRWLETRTDMRAPLARRAVHWLQRIAVPGSRNIIRRMSGMGGAPTDRNVSWKRLSEYAANCSWRYVVS